MHHIWLSNLKVNIFLLIVLVFSKLVGYAIYILLDIVNFLLCAQAERSRRTLLPGGELAVPRQLFLDPGEGDFEFSGGLLEELDLTLMDLVVAEDDADEFAHEFIALGADVLADPGS